MQDFTIKHSKSPIPYVLLLPPISIFYANATYMNLLLLRLEALIEMCVKITVSCNVAGTRL